MPNFKSIGPFKQNLQRGGGGAESALPRPYQSAKSPACLRLRKTIKQFLLSYDKLLTAIIEIEGVLNSVPLTYIYEDEMDIKGKETNNS